MALKTFTKDKVKRSQPTQWLVNVNLRTGCFYLNNLVADDMGLKIGQYAVVAEDEDSKNWLISFDNKENGYILKILSNHGYRSRLCFSCRRAATALIEAVKAQKAATFLISRKPVEIEGKMWFKILHKQPIRKN